MIIRILNSVLTASPNYFQLFLYFVIVLLVLWYRKRNDRVTQFLASLPGPPALPIIGNIHLFIGKSKKDIIRNTVQVFNDYSKFKIYRFLLATDSFAVIVDPQLIQAVLRTPICYDKDELYNLLGVPDILFTANGKAWLTARKIATSGFHPKILSSLDTVYSHRSVHFLKNLELLASSGEAFNLLPVVLFCTLDIISDTFMGVSIDAQTEKDNKLASSFLSIPEYFVERAVFVLYHNDFLYKLLGKKRQYDACLQDVYTLTQKVIEKRMEIRTEIKRAGAAEETTRGKGNKVYLDILLDKYEAGEIKDLSHLILEAGELFIAGSVTVATVISWTLLLSGVFPEVGEKLYKEVKSCTENSIEDATIESTSKLEYLDMVIKEILRHFTVPFVARRTEKDLITDFATIPAHTRLLILTMNLHHDPKYWEKPYEFYPEHFLPEKVATRPKGTYIPFALGMRDCPGGKYSMQTVKVQVVRILSKIKFTPERMKAWRHVFAENSLTFGFTLIPSRGFLVTAKVREEE